MIRRLTRYLVFALLFGVVYFFSSRHIVFYGKQFHLLPKEKFTLEYTFYSVKGKSPEAVMEVAPLRLAGIGEILVERGIITEDERYELERYFEYENDFD